MSMRIGVLTSASFFYKSISRVCENNVNIQCLRLMHSMSVTMATAGDLERVNERAEKTESILENLRNQIKTIKKAAVKQAGLAREEQFAEENATLKQEIESLKMKLIIAEMGQGVRQVYTPSPATAAAKMATTASSESASIDGPKPETTEKEETKEGTPVKENGKEASVGGGKKAKTEKKEKKANANSEKTKKAASGGGDNTDTPVDISRLDMRVGKIIAVEQHPDAATLYVEKVDLGEGKIRTIVSGLVPHVPINEMQDRIAVFMCNLKPTKLRGILSEGMIMCAAGLKKTEILVPPADSVIGDRVTCEQYPGQPDQLLNPKKKIWETLKPDVRTNKDRVATYKGSPFTIQGKGVVVAPTLADSQIS